MGCFLTNKLFLHLLTFVQIIKMNFSFLINFLTPTIQHLVLLSSLLSFYVLAQ